jgi:hypothetical protein
LSSSLAVRRLLEKKMTPTSRRHIRIAKLCSPMERAVSVAYHCASIPSRRALHRREEVLETGALTVPPSAEEEA